jgi:hypothetical protein
MLLLGLDSLLLIFITFGLGYLGQKLLSRFFAIKIQADALGVFIAGLILSTIYFHILSLWLPVNYYSLLPLFVASVIGLIHQRSYLDLYKWITSAIKFFFRKDHLVFTLPLLLTIFIYSIIPPMNYDSGDYHYLSILWYEKFKVVPGLANVHGRLAFNPSSFIISSAYSFTNAVGQSIYPLNGVIVGLFLFWILRLLLKNVNAITSIIYLILLFFYFRPLLANISSPASEPLVIVCVCYAVVSVALSIHNKQTGLQYLLLPLIILVYSLTAKLSSIPALLVTPFIFFILPKTERNLQVFIKLVVVATVIIFPWLTRNVILSGYPLYPSPALNIFKVDWKAPLDVVRLDYVSFSSWFPLLTYGKLSIDFLIFLAAILSPLYWIFSFRRRKQISNNIVVLWLIIYIAVWLWLMNSPEYRFGIMYLSLAFALPLLFQSNTTVSSKIIRATTIILFLIICGYYSREAINKSYTFSIADCWLFPLRDSRYFSNNQEETFRYKQLNNGVKLYLADSTHECINADLPCMSWYYGEIEMRGDKIEDGFRNKTDEVRKHFPVLNQYFPKK